MFEHKNALFHRSQTMVLRPYYEYSTHSEPHRPALRATYSII